jgi:hypothetical protein
LPRSAQGDDEATPGGHADTQALLGPEPLPSLGQRGLGWLGHEAAPNGQRRLLAEGPAAPRVRARRESPAGPAPPQPCLAQRLADPTEGRERAWRAAARIRGAENLRSQVKGVGLQAPSPKG